jgi:hypothetical protein
VRELLEAIAQDRILVGIDSVEDNRLQRRAVFAHGTYAQAGFILGRATHDDAEIGTIPIPHLAGNERR